MRLGTKAIHAGQTPDPTTGAIMTPIFCTSTYVQEYPAVIKDGYDYSRGKNPTRTALEQNLAALENGRHGLSFASGLAGLHAIVSGLVAPGERIVAGNDLYGGTFRMLRRVFEPLGYQLEIIDTTDLDQVADALGGRLKLTSRWEGNRMQVVGQGVSGHIDVDDVSVRIHVSMGLTMLMFREPIRSAIESSIDQYID